ncbi:glycine zipper domain-containing protein [Paraburkholderia sp. DHOC27]|uniref:glycine zipper domain-containing protein n=1 Tax=Paraburkholderia sp. DHOC27 TaxID=2303330 RepID=UPI000E3BF13E|nr:glycine zipper domain-containing protein [Paraburkholderia sp. DHOC27]RFU49632.1 glycine zipper family protein [Paraburkholderia sp. DHOC27]
MKLSRISRLAVPLALVAVALTGCAVMPPTGPTVVALPPNGKPLNQFQQEDYACRDYAFRSDDAGQASQSALQGGVGSTAIGTLGGAAAGALLGAAGGNAGVGAAIGAGAGMLLGGAVGTHNVQDSSDSLQARYDASYAQCMASKGNTISAPPPGVYSTMPAYAPPPVMVAPPPMVYGTPGYWAY